MAFEQNITLPSQHDISYWRITNADIDFMQKTARFMFGGYKDYQTRLEYEDTPVKRHTIFINDSQVFESVIPDYDTALPKEITTDLLIGEANAPFSGATILSNMTWNYDTDYRGLTVSHFRVRNLRMNWNRQFAQLTISAYKNEATFDPNNPTLNTTQIDPRFMSYRYSTSQFNTFFDASSVGGTTSVTDPETGTEQQKQDPLESQIGFDRSTVYEYAKNNDPFFENAVDSAQ